MPKGPKGGKYIETPEKMWELFTAYKKHVKDNPRIKVEYVGKEGDRVETPLVTPLTMVGYECYVMDNTKFTCADLTDYFEGKDPSYTAYLPIATRIRKEIRQDQVSGGMVGQYNSNLTARLNNLKEHTDNSNTNKNITLLTNDPLSDE